MRRPYAGNCDRGRPVLTMDQNAHGRRPHYQRGRRGSERRGGERRTQPAPATPQQDQAAREQRDQVDIEQVMRDIRARISKGSGVDLTNQQIRELAASRLEAILDPRTIKPALLEQLRRGAAAPADAAQPQAAGYEFDEATLYETESGFVRVMRRLLNPLLKLLINPAPIAAALNTQATLNRDAAARDAARDRRQAEWNALHYELLQKVVTETSRVSIEMQSLALKAESLAAKVDFNERRVRGIENATHQARPAGRQQEPTPYVPPQREREPAQREREREPAPAPAPRSAGPAPEPPPAPTPEGGVRLQGGAGEVPSDGSRKRRRRRRGRRSGSGQPGTGLPAGAAGPAPAAGDTDTLDTDTSDVDAAEVDAADVDMDVDEPGDDEPAIPAALPETNEVAAAAPGEPIEIAAAPPGPRFEQVLGPPEPVEPPPDVTTVDSGTPAGAPQPDIAAQAEVATPHEMVAQREPAFEPEQPTPPRDEAAAPASDAHPLAPSGSGPTDR